MDDTVEETRSNSASGTSRQDYIPALDRRSASDCSSVLAVRSRSFVRCTQIPSALLLYCTWH